MEVSIIIPVYNVSKYIERCLLSALNQTWQDLEVIVVDDCTPDNSMDIVRQVITTHPRGNIVTCLAHEKNRGLSAARNTGIKNAAGRYLYFLDSDDYVAPDCIALLSTDKLLHNPDFVIGNYKVVGAERWAPPLKLSSGLIEGNEAILKAYVHDEWYVMAWNKLINKEFLIQHNLYFQEGIVHEDDLWSFQLACVAEKMFVVNAVSYFYFIQPDSIMRAPSLFNLECRVKVIQYIYQYILTSKKIKCNPDIYVYFENLKAKYFDRMLYYTNDNVFLYNSYLQFRANKYSKDVNGLSNMRFDFKLMLRNVHYLLPKSMGYSYFRLFVRIEYYVSVLFIRLKRFYL